MEKSLKMNVNKEPIKRHTEQEIIAGLDEAQKAEYNEYLDMMASATKGTALYKLSAKSASNFLEKVENDRITRLENKMRDDETARLTAELAARDAKEREKEEHFRLFGEARSGEPFKYAEAGEAAKLLAPYLDDFINVEFNEGKLFGYEATGWKSDFGWGVAINGYGASVNRLGGEPFKHKIVGACWQYDKESMMLTPMKSYKGFFPDIPKAVTNKLKNLLPFIIRKKKEVEAEDEEDAKEVKDDKEVKEKAAPKLEKKRVAKSKDKNETKAKKAKVEGGKLNVETAENEKTD